MNQMWKYFEWLENHLQVFPASSRSSVEPHAESSLPSRSHSSFYISSCPAALLISSAASKLELHSLDLPLSCTIKIQLRMTFIFLLVTFMAFLFVKFPRHSYEDRTPDVEWGLFLGPLAHYRFALSWAENGSSIRRRCFSVKNIFIPDRMTQASTRERKNSTTTTRF